VEHFDGRFEVLSWTDTAHARDAVMQRTDDGIEIAA
jgi:hypothetical protein